MTNLIKIEKGVTFLREGDQGSSAYYLISGKMIAVKNINGKSVKLSEISSGSIFGEICLIDNQTRTTSIETLETCTIQQIDSKNIENIIKKDPVVGLAIIKTLTVRFRSIMELLESENLE